MIPLLIPTADPKVYEINFDNSSLELYTTCKRKAQMYSITRREPAVTGAALFFGTVAHGALTIRKSAMVTGNPAWETEQVDYIIRKYTENPSAIEEWRTPDLLIDVIKAYNKRWPLAEEPFTIVDAFIEKSFRLFLGDAEVEATLQTPTGPVYVESLRIYYTGRLDACIKMFEQIFVMDHKTASVTGESYYEDFELSSQMLGYTWALRELGYPAVGLFADVLETRKPSATGKSINQRRQPYWYNDFHVDEWKMDTLHLISAFIEEWITGFFAKGTKWCHGKYGRCGYWQVCTQPSVEGRAAVLDSELYKNVEWSPLNETD